MKRVILVYSIIFAVIAVAIIAIGTIGITKQHNHIYVVPEGYAGWVQVTYDQPDAAELPREGQAILHIIPEDGVLRTASPPTSGVDIADDDRAPHSAVIRSAS